MRLNDGRGGVIRTRDPLLPKLPRVLQLQKPDCKTVVSGIQRFQSVIDRSQNLAAVNCLKKMAADCEAHRRENSKAASKCFVPLPAGFLNPSSLTARPGSTASNDAGLRLQGQPPRRRTFRAHRLLGEKPSRTCVAPSVDAPKGKRSFPLPGLLARSGARGKVFRAGGCRQVANLHRGTA
jgi:hypothetical protein